MKFRKIPQNLIYGKFPVMEAFQSDKKIDKLLIQSGLNHPILKEIIQKAHNDNIPYQFVPEIKLKKMTNATHQGVVAFLSLVEYASLEDILSQAYATGELPLILFLDGLKDVRNFGAIVRTALGMNAHAVVIPSAGSVAVTADAIKTSAGAMHKMPICRVQYLRDGILYAKEQGLSIMSSTLSRSVALTEVDLNVPLGIVMGSEEEGVNKGIVDISDYCVRIPQSSDLQSYNVSVAAGMLLYETHRQRKLSK